MTIINLSLSCSALLILLSIPLTSGHPTTIRFDANKKYTFDIQFHITEESLANPSILGHPDGNDADGVSGFAAPLAGVPIFAIADPFEDIQNQIESLKLRIVSLEDGRRK